MLNIWDRNFQIMKRNLTIKQEKGKTNVARAQISYTIHLRSVVRAAS